MTHPYPLYDMLLEKVHSQREKSLYVGILSATIGSMPQKMSKEAAYEHHREIAALILHHEIISNGGTPLSFTPYEGKVMPGGSGILNNITNFPALLQQILARYIEEYAIKTPIPAS